MNQAMLLRLDADASDFDAVLTLEHSRKLAKVGQELLNSEAKPIAGSSTTLSWQAQSAKVTKGEPFDVVWELGLCPGGLSESFRRAKLATLQASNNVAAILSQNIEYADRKGWIREMEQRANDLVKKVNPRCLAVQNNDPRKNRDIYKTLDRIQAAFFDTAAAVQSALSARETNQKEMRLRLCDAYKYANRAIGLQL